MIFPASALLSASIVRFAGQSLRSIRNGDGGAVFLFCGLGFFDYGFGEVDEELCLFVSGYGGNGFARVSAGSGFHIERQFG